MKWGGHDRKREPDQAKALEASREQNSTIHNSFKLRTTQWNGWRVGYSWKGMEYVASCNENAQTTTIWNNMKESYR